MFTTLLGEHRMNFTATDTAIVPTYATEQSAGADLYADNVNGMKGEWTLQINPGETIKVGTGVCIALPEGHFGGIYARSGLATKQGLAPANKVGVIDADYRGELIVALHNHSSIPQMLHSGDRIAQIVIIPYIRPIWNKVESLDDTDRGDGGFGSSGK